MFRNREADDMRGLEEVFHSQQFSQVSDSVGRGVVDSIPAPAGHGDGTFFKRIFGSAAMPASALHRDDAARPDNEAARQLDAESFGGGAEDADGSAEPPWKRQPGRYWTIAACGALVALVVAGVTAGADDHRAPGVSAQGSHGVERAHGGQQGPGVASTRPSMPGSSTGAVGSGVLALGTPSGEMHTLGTSTTEAAGGRVTLAGAATTTGSPPAASSGGGSPAAPSIPGGSNPSATPVASVGSSVAGVGPSVTGVANQLGTTVPVAAPITNAVSGAVSAVNQVVSPALL